MIVNNDIAINQRKCKIYKSTVSANKSAEVFKGSPLKAVSSGENSIKNLADKKSVNLVVTFFNNILNKAEKFLGLGSDAEKPVNVSRWKL